MWVTSSTHLARTPTAIALGKFDGVHRGHLRVIEPTIQNRPQPRLTPPYATVVTFNPHPQEFFSGTPRTLLTPLEEKVQLLQDFGVEQLVLLPFNRELCELEPEEFVEKILIEQLQAVSISVGADFRFGAARKGTAENLQAIAAKFSIPVHIASLETHGHSSESLPDTDDSMRISTSRIREVLIEGDITTANHLLGRAYSLIGKVVTGQKLGRTLGFPTANLQLPVDKFLPKKGVYAVRVAIGSRSTPQYGVMNIGSRPTVAGQSISVEVHLLEWDGDLYGQTIVVDLQEFIRSEQKFPSLDALKRQINLDCLVARKIFQN